MGVYQLGTGVVITEAFSVEGTLTNPTTVTFEVASPDNTVTTYVMGVDIEVTHPSLGTYVLSLAPAQVDIPGQYHYSCAGTGTVLATSEGDFTILPSSVDPSAGLGGPCTAWCDSQDVNACLDSTGDKTQFAFEASAILYENSGRLWSGVCEKTVRPCATRGCGFQILSRGHIVGPWDYGYGYGDGYGWWGTAWMWNGSTPCGCMPLSRVRLSGYPVSEIIEVLIDGVAVDPVTYRLDEHRWLTRVRNPADVNTPLFWPACQQLDLADTEVGTWSVTYRYGQTPPLIGQHAAAQLAAELWKACNGQECQLPAGTTRITRNGLTVERTFFQRDRAIGAWRTGLSLVDMFLNTYNPSGLRRRPSVWAPSSTHRYARPVGN